MRFDLPDPPDARALRTELRAFLAEQGRDWTPETRARSWMGFDRGFSREVGARGWIGMTWPEAYGGHERSALERVVVLEEMLAVGARSARIGSATGNPARSSCASVRRSSGGASCPASPAASWPSASGCPSRIAAATSHRSARAANGCQAAGC
jgi:hypothetical protein